MRVPFALALSAVLAAACSSSSNDADPNPTGGDVSDGGGRTSTEGGAGLPDASACPRSAPVHQSVPPGKTLLRDGYSFYPRVIELEHAGAANGNLVATVVTNIGGDWVGAMFESTDHGTSFKPIGVANDPTNRTGMCCHTLYELPVAIGSMPAGTLLWAASFGANAPVDRRMSERIMKSTDRGKTWSFLAMVTQSASTAGTWEPEFTVSADGHLVIFYSDETDPTYSQKLVAARSVDGVTWTDFKPVVALPSQPARPGMAGVRKLPNGSYIMSYEVCASDGSHACEVYVRGSKDGWDWGNPADIGARVATASGEFPASAPTISLSGNTLLMKAMRLRNADFSFSAGDGRTLLANTNGGQGPWFQTASPVPMSDAGEGLCPGYSNPVLGSSNGKSVFAIVTDFDANQQCRAYMASAPIVPIGGTSAPEASPALGLGAQKHVFARSPAGDLRHWSFDGSAAAVADTWGNAIVGQPAAFVFGAQQHVFARTSSGALEHWFVDAGNPSVHHDSWATGIAADPAALVVGDAQHAWAVDTAGALRHWWWSAAQGPKQDTWGQGVTGRPSALLAGGAQHVFARSLSGGIEHTWWNAGQGSQHETIDSQGAAAVCSAPPALAGEPVAVELDGALHVWAVDASGSLQHLWWNPSHPWAYETWGENLVGRPSFLRVGDAQHVFVRSKAGAVEHYWWNPAQGLQHDTWSGNVVVAGDPAAVLNGDEQHVFAPSASGALEHWSWAPGRGIAHDTAGP
jgi:hypothetical protein